MVPELTTQCKLKNKIFIHIFIHSSSVTDEPIVTKFSPVINNINGLRLNERVFDLMDFFGEIFFSFNIGNFVKNFIMVKIDRSSGGESRFLTNLTKICISDNTVMSSNGHRKTPFF